MILSETRITRALIRSAQAGLRLCCSQTPKTGFLTSSPIWHIVLAVVFYALLISGRTLWGGGGWETISYGLLILFSLKKCFGRVKIQQIPLVTMITALSQ